MKEKIHYNSFKTSDCNGIRTHNYLVRKQTLPVWLNGYVFVYEWLWV